MSAVEFRAFEYLSRIEKHWIHGAFPTPFTSNLLLVQVETSTVTYLPTYASYARYVPACHKSGARRYILYTYICIYVKMSISTTGAQFPWTRKCVVSPARRRGKIPGTFIAIFRPFLPRDRRSRREKESKNSQLNRRASKIKIPLLLFISKIARVYSELSSIFYGYLITNLFYIYKQIYVYM